MRMRTPVQLTAAAVMSAERDNPSIITKFKLRMIPLIPMYKMLLFGAFILLS